MEILQQINVFPYFIIIIAAFVLLFLGSSITLFIQHLRLKQWLQQQTDQHQEVMNSHHHALINTLHQNQLNTLQQTQTCLYKAMGDVREQLFSTLKHHADNANQQIEKLTHNTDQRLQQISGQVEKRLTEGFEKTTETFHHVLQRLALIDQAQKKITELSANVVDLQQVLSDKKSRGAFGEVQLSALLHNMIPEQHFSMQHTLSNGKRADCVLFLPPPTGNIAIDAKFPLETFRALMANDLSVGDKKALHARFRQDIRHHIQSIAERYIIPEETAQGAVMFLPAEAIFAEIHANFPDLVDLAQQHNVWIVSPTTMMAILTTARAVLKDEATRQQVHIIQQHLALLAKDFTRFEKRMENLAKHIEQAHNDVTEVNTSAKKITRRFTKIEQAELPTLE